MSKMKQAFIRSNKHLLGQNLSYTELDGKYITWLEGMVSGLKCCANCGDFECPHRDIHSRVPCEEEPDDKKWIMPDNA